MNAQTFLFLLMFFSTISGLATEVIKTIIVDKDNRAYNIIALSVALVVGTVGTLIAYQLSYVPFTLNNIIYAVLMGLASGLCSMVGYDKVKQAIEQLGGK